jgi:hypothetical protein
MFGPPRCDAKFSGTDFRTVAELLTIGLLCFTGNTLILGLIWELS